MDNILLFLRKTTWKKKCLAFGCRQNGAEAYDWLFSFCSLLHARQKLRGLAHLREGSSFLLIKTYRCSWLRQKRQDSRWCCYKGSRREYTGGWFRTETAQQYRWYSWFPCTRTSGFGKYWRRKRKQTSVTDSVQYEQISVVSSTEQTSVIGPIQYEQTSVVGSIQYEQTSVTLAASIQYKQTSVVRSI